MMWLLVAPAVLAAICIAAWAFFLRPVVLDRPQLKGEYREFQISHGGLRRSFGVYLPPGAQPLQRILVLLHGSRGDGAQFREWTGRAFDAVADSRGFAVMYPDGWEGHWNDCRRIGPYAAKQLGVPDVSFLEAAVSMVASGAPVEVGVAGYSNGGQMALRWALEGTMRLKGLLMIGANVPADDNMVCERRRPLPPAAIVAGTQDRVSPFAGGRVSILGSDRGSVRSAPDSAAWLGGELVVMEGGGHTVPQPRAAFPRLLGPTSADFNSAEFAADLFSWR